MGLLDDVTKTRGWLATRLALLKVTAPKLQRRFSEDTKQIAYASDPGWRALMEEAVGQVGSRMLTAVGEVDLSASQIGQIADNVITHAFDEAQRHMTGAPGSFALDRSSMERLRVAPTLCHVTLIRAAVDRAEYGDAALRALLRAKLMIDTPPELLVEVLVGLDSKAVEVFLALARTIDGEVLLEELLRGRFGASYLDFNRSVYAAFAVWQGAPTDRGKRKLVRLLRLFARMRRLPLSASALLGWLTDQVDEPDLRELYRQRHRATDEKLEREFCDSMVASWNLSIDQIVAVLPERVPDSLVDTLPLRAAPQVGRNAKCPCGSGLKFKKCCESRLGESETRSRPSRAEAIRERSAGVDPREIAGMERADVARLDLSRLRDDTLREVLRNMSFAHDWLRARRARDELVRRGGKAAADALWRDTVYEAMRIRNYEAARELFQELYDRSGAAYVRGALALDAAKEEEGLTALENFAREALQGDQVSPAGLARAVMPTLPALGILLARGAYPSPGDRDAREIESFLLEVEDARAELDLPLRDPAHDILSALGAVQEKDEGVDPDQERLAQATAALQAELDEKTRRLTQLERQLAEQALEATSINHPPLRAAAATVNILSDAAQLARRKQQRIEELEGLVRSGNEERSELRNQRTELQHRLADLAQQSAGVAARPPARETHDDDDFGEALSVVDGRGVLIPEFGGRAEAAFKVVPTQIATAAVYLIGRLAAQDVAAWKPVKAAKGMPRQVLTARVGIHYRLLFRVDDGRLGILDLVTRENLLLSLKRLAAA